MPEVKQSSIPKVKQNFPNKDCHYIKNEALSNFETSKNEVENSEKQNFA